MKKWKKISLTFVIIAFFSSSTSLSTLALKADYAGTLTTMMSADILTLNPFFFGMLSENYVIDHIYEPLVRFDVNNNPTPALCSAWVVSSDNMKYTFTLRSDAYWHDSQPVTIDDIEFTWLMLAGDPGIPRRSWLFDSVHDIIVHDSSTIEIQFTYSVKPTDVLLYIAGTYIVPEHIWDTIDIYDFTNDNPIGCGPFKFVSRDPAIQIVLARHADYHLPGPWVNEKIIKIIPDQATAFNDFNTSAIEVLSDPTVSQENYAKTDSDIAIHRTIRDYWMYLGLNQRRYPNNITEFRRAIYYGMNRSEIVSETRDGRGEICPASCSLPYGPYYNPSVPTYDFNWITANTTLDMIGVIDSDADGWREANGTEISFEILVDSGSQESIDSVNLIKGYMHDIGINVTVSPVTWPTLWERSGGAGQVGGDYNYPGKYDYDWCLMGWSGFWSDFHPSWMQWLFSVSSWWGSDDVNIPGWKSSVRWEVEDLIQQIAFETDEVAYTALLKEAQLLVADDLPYLPLNILGSVTLIRVDEFEDWSMGYAKGPDSWDSWLTVHLIGVPTVFEYIKLAGILAVIVFGLVFVNQIKNLKKKRR